MKLVNYWDYTEMHGQRNIKKLLSPVPTIVHFPDVFLHRNLHFFLDIITYLFFRRTSSSVHQYSGTGWIAPKIFRWDIPVVFSNQ